MSVTKKFTMKYVSSKSGLTPHTIRVWEKRYGAVIPERTETNHRLFSEEDVERLQILRQATLEGHPIGRIARLSLEDLKNLLEKESEQAPVKTWAPPDLQIDSAGKLVHEALASLVSFDRERLEKVMHQALAAFGRRLLIEKFLSPFLERQGELWREGDLRIAHEHFSSAAVGGFLENLYRQAKSSPKDRTLLLATPAGQYHEFGALFAAIEASSCGWNPLYLGPNLPDEEIAGAAGSNRVRAVALSIIYPADDSRLGQELLRLRQCLSPEIPIVVGGRAATGYREPLEAIGAEILTGLDSLHRFLERIPASETIHPD